LLKKTVTIYSDLSRKVQEISTIATAVSSGPVIIGSLAP
jgi:uncharacterized protein YoxC